MNEQKYQEIELSKITPHPDNPRTNFSGAEFEELAASIKEHGAFWCLSC